MAADDTTTPRDGGPPPLRIGDAERQRMTDLLQQHLAAGRLDMQEFERRVEHATSAVYEQDLDGLLDDLPRIDEDGEPVPSRARRRPGRVDDRPDWDPSTWASPSGGRWRGPGWRGIPFPLLAVGAIALVVVTHGWILFPLLFLFVASRGGCGPWDRGRHHRDRHREGYDDHPRSGHHDGGAPRWPGRFEPAEDDRRM